MDRKLLISSLGLLVFASAIILVLSLDNIFIITIAGLFFVIGGTLLTTLISESSDLLIELTHEVRQLFKPRHTSLKGDYEKFKTIADIYRAGQIRHAESIIPSLMDPHLRKGVSMVIDGFSFEQIEHFMQWNINAQKEDKAKRLQLLQVMTGLAPAFGMLGTLLGLVQLLFNLNENGIEQAGVAMGFAMVTTFYGLIITNVLLKPMTLKLEKKYQYEIRQEIVKYNLVQALYKRESMLKIDSLIKRELIESSDINTFYSQDNRHSLAYTQVR